jgi:hypothetical protein
MEQLPLRLPLSRILFSLESSSVNAVKHFLKQNFLSIYERIDRSLADKYYLS